MKDKEPFISIIIPCKGLDDYAKECVKKCLELDYKNYEILLLPDKKPDKIRLKSINSKRLRIIYTGNFMPGIKRNIGMNNSKADIYAFIDSDAYPEKNWLKNAVRILKKQDIGLVGGPNLTPSGDNFKQRLSGMLLATYFCGGRTSIRYRIAKEKETIELPSCNSIVKKEYATEFEPDLLTAEDTKFCFNVWKKKKRILYSPDVIVYHHRRPIFKQHLKQMWVYGRDVGILLKRKGQFSIDKLYYLIPSIFVLGVVFGAIISFFNPILRIIYFSVLILYLFLVLISSMRKDLKTIPLIIMGIITTHFVYGLGFLYGLFRKSKNKSD